MLSEICVKSRLLYRLEPALLSIGVTRGEINFTDVRIYDRDRTICDVLRNMNKMDKEIFNKAIQGYVNDPQKNVPNLIEYAKTMRVSHLISTIKISLSMRSTPCVHGSYRRNAPPSLLTS